MSRNVFYLVLGAIVLAGCVNVHKTEHVHTDKAALEEGTTCQGPAKVLRHVVLFKFKDDTAAKKVKEIEDAFAALPAKIDAIHDLEWGTDVSVEGRAQGFTHCFLVSFASEADRGKYIPHPEHKAFGGLLGPHLDKVLVIDYWTN